VTRRALALLFALQAFACGAGAPPRAYSRAVTAASNALGRGDQGAAAEHFLAASRAARVSRDRDEMRYRAAAAYERAGAVRRALSLYETLATGAGERAARASFDSARLVGRDAPKQGDRLLLRAIHRFSGSGLAPRALHDHLAYVETDQGLASALTELDRLTAALGESELGETLCYERGRRLERAERLPEARDAYLETARRYPYPHGVLWDDALAGAARAEEALGRPKEAVRLLERMLAEHEDAHVVGSYVRSRYAPARFRIAELRRDALGEREQALREFRRVYTDFPTSLLGDDALFEEAVLAKRMGKDDAACEAMEVLTQNFPASRFAGCAPSLCGRIPSTRGQRCPRTLSTATQSFSSFSSF
jgi:tetratricopeptide (TPR) repeat protein